MYRTTPDLDLGIEYNPLDDALDPLVNYRLVGETEGAPAVILGTSSDRIGTPGGQAYYVTASKSLQHETGLPIAPYAGISYGSYDEKADPIGGLNVRYSEAWSSTHLCDGHNLHHMLNLDLGEGRPTLGLLLVHLRGYHLGFNVAFSFDF